ncbi:DUF4623 domain-containing protein [candidate division KSB1 bacterium]|nr:DUF4623 domain-containing protein [candidate division KSB1 bacterium]
MNKIRLFLCLLIIGSSMVAAQYPLNWANYAVMNPGNDVTRSIAYNRSTDHVLVATRKYGTDVIILNAATGDSLGKLDTGIVSGGTYPINMVDVAKDGTIYVCNLSAPQYSPGSTLKVYRYVNEMASPELVFDDALDGERYGDALAAVGSGDEKYVYVSGMGNATLAVMKDEGGAMLTKMTPIPLPQPGAARHGISPVSAGGKLWINGADAGSPPPQLVNNDGTVIAVVPDSLASAGGTSSIIHLRLGDYNLVTVANSWGLSIRTARYFEDELGTITFDYFGNNSDSVNVLYEGNTFINNINATVDLDYDSKRHSIISVFGYNSVTSMSMDSLLKASTPREDSLTISVDGSNDFFPTDHVGCSNERNMYLTWSEGKVFAGISGHTLIDPAESNRMYVAFDLDPDSDAGSTTPPEKAGGIAALPFKADVVYMVEPWNQPDYMIGSIYKWDGSSWIENLFDGNMANQGALAYADEGEDKLAELAAIKNSPGIGDAFTAIGMMAYVTKKTASGEVLCAFPDVNPLGNGVSFSHYFYADSFGRGIFPTDTDRVQIRTASTSAVKATPVQVIQSCRLWQNYPNPFNPRTTIRFDMAKPGHAKLRIYDVTGRLVETLVDQKKKAGSHKLTFNAEHLSSGVYFYKLIVDRREVSVDKMILMK